MSAAEEAVDEAYMDVLANLNGAEGEEAGGSFFTNIPLADEQIEVRDETTVNGVRATVPLGKLSDRVERFKKIIKDGEVTIARLGKDYDWLEKEIEVFMQQELTEEESGTNVEFAAKIDALRMEIEGLGEEEIAELEQAKKSEEGKAKKMAMLLKELDGLDDD